MTRTAAAVLLSLLPGVAATQADAPPAAVVQAIQNARAGGCESRGGPPGAVQPDVRLVRAAARLARGAALEAALAAEGYRHQRASVVALQGYRGAALAQGLVRHACHTLLQPAWQHLGLHQSGDAAWVILAEPFSPPRPEEASRMRAEVLRLTNQARAQPRRCGERHMDAAPPLKASPLLERTAEMHAVDLARHGDFSHTGRDGSQVGQRADRSGYAWRRIGENLAAGQATAAAAVQGWLASPGHCANLMQPDFTEMGLAYAVNLQSPGGIYWVQVLGTPR